ncbi:MAG: DUF3857 and transglutaminase domain-containing protein [candidate division WOR-3 bacterium]|nr:DUF3857 and transglutaminase domain-containing protein [candidate division WOR-3 bacterium]
MRRNRNFLLIILAFILFTATKCAKRIIYPPILTEVESEKYPDSDGVVVYDSTLIKVNKDGSHTSTHHKLIKILSTYGKKKFGEQIFSFNTKWDTLMVLSGRVYKPDGKVIEVTKENIDVYPMPAWEGAKFFIPNSYVVKITYPQIEEFSAVEFKVKDIYREALFPNHFQSYFLFEDEQPIIEKTVQVEISKDMNLRYAVLRGKIPLKKEEKKGRVIYRWSDRDIPAIEKEPVMPPIPDVAPKLLISTLPSWEYFSRWYYKISKVTFEPDSAIKNLVSKLIQKQMTDEEKISTLFHWSVSHIRYVETKLSGAKAGFKPAPARTTLKRKYGVCRDKAAFLVSLLKEAGIESKIVLTNPMQMVEDNLPVDQFNHAVVAIEGPVGYFYLDPTAENSRVYLPAYEFNHKAMLIATPKGDPLRYTPLQDPEKNTLKMIGRSKLTKENKISGTIKVKPTGLMDFSLRNLFKQAPPEMVDRIVSSFVKGSNPSAVIDTFWIEGLESLKEPLSISIKYRIDEYGSAMGDIFALKAPLGGSGNVSVSIQGGNPFALDKRRYPVNLMVTLSQSYHEEMEIPSSYRIQDLPDKFDLSNKYLGLKQNYEIKGNKIVIDRDFRILRPWIPIEDYPEVKKLIQGLEKSAREKILLKRR